ncbi:MAG: class I SAM-dependent methyltransferase [Gammaproteobacteria bacterium]|nr:class I SAM-dependent methyltransferase [Gammaproteobacteria bacterium]
MTPFKSTAEFYSRFRVPYPESLVAGLKADAGLGYDARVLDLATGPGRLALALAPSLCQVVAVDVEIEMLEEGKCVARRKGVANIRWVHSRAEDLTVAPGTVDLVTIGEAFHRLDQDVVLRRIRQWLRAGACVAIVGCFGVLDGGYAWQESLRRAVSDWTKERPAVPSGPPRGKVHDARRLVEAGFADVMNREFVESHTWTRESVLGHLHSTSRFSLAALGDELDDFDRVVLAALGPDGPDRFPQEVSSGYTIGWNAGV